MVKPGAPAEHLAKAAGFLRAVRVLLDAGLAEQATADAYYAAFHTAQALLAAAGFAAETHAGVHTLLARQFVKPGAVPSRVARDFAHLMSDRLLADYGVDRQIDTAGALEAAATAARVIEAILDALSEQAPEAAPQAKALRVELAGLRPAG